MKATLTNFVFENIVVSDIFSNNFLSISQNSGSNLTMSGFYFRNSFISDAKSILYMTSSNATVSVEKIYFTDNQFSDAVSAVRLGEYREAIFSEMVFEGNSFPDTTADTNLLINLNDISSTVNSTISFSKITVTNSTIPLLKIANSNQSKTISQQISFGGISYRNCTFAFAKNLIHLESIKSDGAFVVNFSDLVFEGIIFQQFGNLLYLQHQANEEVQISNSVFSDIYFAGIAAESFDKNSLDKRTLIRMSNITAHNINGVSGSFIQIFEGVTLTVTDSSFYYITNYGSGGVISAGYQAAVADIFDSEFYNNTSVEGGVFVAESKSVVK
jgi:hypothetical protein